jgi:calcineurin-like phosphoesterase family protein
MKPDWLNLDTWLISDTHWGHDNIVKYCGRPRHHDQLMLDNWRRLVGPDDTVLHLGDLAYPSKARGRGLDREIRGLPGHKFLIKGNHDNESKEFYRHYFGFEVVGRSTKGFNWLEFEDNNRRVILSHFPWTIGREWKVNIHGHIHNNGYSVDVLGMGKDHRNISVEVMNYEPVKLGWVLHHGRFQRPGEAGSWNDGDRRERFETYVLGERFS